MSVLDQLQDLFRTVFNDDDLMLSDQTTAADIPAWDSVATVNLMFMIEQAFSVQFPGDTFVNFGNIGELRVHLEQATGRAAA